MTLVLCGSMTFEDDMREIASEILKMGIQTIVPESDVDKKVTEDYKRRIARRYMRNIIHKDTYAILVVNKNKGDKKNHIGPNTFAEISLAWFNKKKVYLYNDIPNNQFEDELHAWNVICLNEDLSRIKDDLLRFKRENVQTCLPTEVPVVAPQI